MPPPVHLGVRVVVGVAAVKDVIVATLILAGAVVVARVVWVAMRDKDAADDARVVSDEYLARLRREGM